MNRDDLTQALGLMLQALHAMPATAGDAPAASVAAPGRTLSDWLDVHARLISEKGLKPQTVSNRSANIKHIRRIWGQQPIKSVRPHEVSAGLREFLPQRSSTAQRVLAELRDAYAEAVANDWADNNPALHVKMPKHRVKRHRLTAEVWQAMRILAQAIPQSWVEPMLLLALITGQRRADLAKMRFDDVVDGCLRIEQQKHAGKGYGARIELPLALRLDAIGITLGDVIDQCRACGAPGPTLLRKAGGGSIEQSSLSARFHQLIVAVLGSAAHPPHEWPSLHEVRSLSARMYRAQGLDVQTLLGHKHADMTAIYEDDRGLSAGEWKRLDSAAQGAAA